MELSKKSPWKPLNRIRLILTCPFPCLHSPSFILSKVFTVVWILWLPGSILSINLVQFTLWVNGAYQELELSILCCQRQSLICEGWLNDSWYFIISKAVFLYFGKLLSRKSSWTTTSFGKPWHWKEQNYCAYALQFVWLQSERWYRYLWLDSLQVAYISNYIKP